MPSRLLTSLPQSKFSRQFSHVIMHSPRHDIALGLVEMLTTNQKDLFITHHRTQCILSEVNKTIYFKMTKTVSIKSLTWPINLTIESNEHR
jgi:hypothetical protein